ncbi:MAG TPA: hypothetical protein PJ986_07665 [Gammaproteobacteria bacterium]|nr:hypothetical protein [Gammaproteobacteria bacterium]
MDIRIAATLVDTLRYRLYAQATMPGEGEIQVEIVPVIGGKERGPRRPAVVADPPASLIAPAMLRPAELSAAIRALREHTRREVQAQLEHFCRSTGRDWQIRRLHYGELLPQPEAAQASTPRTRLALVTEVELGACAPILH